MFKYRIMFLIRKVNSTAVLRRRRIIFQFFLQRESGANQLWWLICAMSYYRVFEAKRRKVATRKPAKWSLFRVFAWRPFDPPHESTKLFMFRLFAFHLSCFRLAGRKVANTPRLKCRDFVFHLRIFAWRVAECYLALMFKRST